jgi:putative ABC transport system ATP-binding protein
MLDAVHATCISKHFKTPNGEVLLWQDVSLRIPEGSSAALLGQPRSGKTTLMHILAGLESLTSGHLVVFGQALEKLTEPEKASYRREVIGLVSPEVPWLPQFSLQDNVALPLLIANVPRREADKRVAELCSLLELPTASSLNQLTPPQRQRWALARGLIHGPKLLLVDGLDALEGETDKVTEHLLELTSNLATTVIFTTRQARVAAYAEQIFTFRQGRLETTSFETKQRQTPNTLAWGR